MLKQPLKRIKNEEKKGISQDLTFILAVDSCESLFYVSTFLSEWAYKMQEDSTFSFAEKNTLLHDVTIICLISH